MEPNDEFDRQFPVTDWPLVRAAGADQLDGWSAALGELLRRYERPLQGYLMEKCRCDEHKAKDLFQGFVLEIVLKRRLVGLAKPERGHQFRSFVLSALSNYVVSEFRKEKTQKREPAGGLSSLEELLESGESDLGQEWAYSFDLSWARAMVTEAMNRMQAECAASGQEAIWGVFESRLKGPILDGADVTPYAELVERYQFASPIQAQNALITAKRKFARALRSVVSDYTADPTAIEVELRELQVILANAATT
jgi:DNA-directed RNA polymerase specialized sigma24 family protein